MAEGLIQEYVPETPAKVSASEATLDHATECSSETFP